jgi:hypothetical protein
MGLFHDVDQSWISHYIVTVFVWLPSNIIAEGVSGMRRLIRSLCCLHIYVCLYLTVWFGISHFNFRTSFRICLKLYMNIRAHTCAYLRACMHMCVCTCMHVCVDLRAIVWLQGFGPLKPNGRFRNQTFHIPACSIVPQPTTLPLTIVAVW